MVKSSHKGLHFLIVSLLHTISWLLGSK